MLPIHGTPQPSNLQRAMQQNYIPHPPTQDSSQPTARLAAAPVAEMDGLAAVS